MVASRARGSAQDAGLPEKNFPKLMTMRAAVKVLDGTLRRLAPLLVIIGIVETALW
jgi:hypothetical protein